MVCVFFERWGQTTAASVTLFRVTFAGGLRQ